MSAERRHKPIGVVAVVHRSPFAHAQQVRRWRRIAPLPYEQPGRVHAFERGQPGWQVQPYGIGVRVEHAQQPAILDTVQTQVLERVVQPRVKQRVQVRAGCGHEAEIHVAVGRASSPAGGIGIIVLEVA